MAVCAICLHPGITAGEHECPGIGEIQLSRHLGRGLVVDQAPPRIRMTLRVLSTAQYGATLQEPDLINIGDQVLYRVTGYDPEHTALLLDLVEDWRPVPTTTLAEAEPTSLAELGDAHRHAHTQRDHWQQRMDEVERQLDDRISKEQH